MSSITLYLLLAIYVFCLLAITWWTKRNESSESYLIAGRDRSWWQVSISKYAGSVGAGWLITYTGFSYAYGWPLNLLVLGAIAGVWVYASWAVPRIRTQQTASAYTQGDFVYAKTNSIVAKQFLNFSTCIMILLTLLIAAVGAASLLETFGFFSYEIALLFTILITTGYVMLSGFKAVMLTDVLQGVLLLLLLVAVVFGLLSAHSVSFESLAERRDISNLGIIILVFFGFMATFADPTRFQVTYAGKSNEAVRKGMLVTIIPLSITIALIYLLANSVYGLDSTLEAAQVFPVALMTYLPDILIPFGILAFFVALMSTVDSYLYALASHSVQLFTHQKLTSKLVQKMIFFYGFLVIAIALVFRDVVDIAVLTGAMLMVIAIPILYLIAGGRDGLRFVLLLAGGYVGMFMGILILGLVPDAGAFVLLGFLCSLLVPKRLFAK